MLSLKIKKEKKILCLHSLEHSPLPPASPTTRVIRVTWTITITKNPGGNLPLVKVTRVTWTITITQIRLAKVTQVFLDNNNNKANRIFKRSYGPQGKSWTITITKMPSHIRGWDWIHPLLKGGYTGHEKTYSGDVGISSGLAET